MSSLPVKSSAITYKLGLTALAASSMALRRQHKSDLMNCHYLQKFSEFILKDFYRVKNVQQIRLRLIVSWLVTAFL